MEAATKETNPHQTISNKLAHYRPRRLHRYASVNVLLLSWEEDDIGCETEIKDLARIFRECLNYAVWPYKIPSDDSEISLSLIIAQFVKSFGQEENLIIVYYGGHGGPKQDLKSPCTWSALVESSLYSD